MQKRICVLIFQKINFIKIKPFQVKYLLETKIIKSCIKINKIQYMSESHIKNVSSQLDGLLIEISVHEEVLKGKLVIKIQREKRIQSISSI